MSKVSYLMRGKKIPLETQTKVIKYLQFVWRQERRDDPEYENFIMSKLSSDLRDEIYLHTNVKYLKNVPVFNDFSEKTLISLARCMKRIRFCPEESVYKVREVKKLYL
jgi:hypothetical protein